MSFKSLTAAAKSWLKMLLRAKKHYTTTQKKELKQAFGLFEVIHDRYIFHSENSLNATTEKVERYLTLYYKYEADFEAICQTEKPAYQSDFHPLSELILFAQFAWFYYELPNSKSMLLKMWQLAKEGKTLSGENLFYVEELKYTQNEGEGHLYQVYLSPYYCGKIWYYLGEIAEKEGNIEEAINYYANFVRIEGEFVHKGDFRKDEYYYYLKTDFPNSTEAWRRMGNLYLQQGLNLKAKNCFEFSLKMPYTKFSSFRELARVFEEERRFLDAYNLIINELAVYLTYKYIPINFEEYFLYCQKIGKKYAFLLENKEYEVAIFSFIFRYYQKEYQDVKNAFFAISENPRIMMPNTCYEMNKIALMEKAVTEINSPSLQQTFEWFLFETVLFARNLTLGKKISKLSNILEKWLTDDKIEDFEKAIAYLPEYYPNQIEYSYQKNYPFKDENDAHFLQKMGDNLSLKYRNQTLLGILAEIEQKNKINEK